MRNRALLALTALAITATPALAQKHSLVFTGRFPFVSLDAPNARQGSSIVEMSEFGVSVVTPGQGAIAHNWNPATNLQLFMGDVSQTGDYTPLRGFKSYFQRINIAGCFIKHADLVDADSSKFFFTVRDVDGSVDLTLLDNNGTTPVTILPGDFVRPLPGGNVEYFCTQAHFISAVGSQSGSHSHGASAIFQDANGDIYYSPAEGGHWVNGNAVGTKYVYDGSICKIPASAITYDANGNVAAIAPDSAYMIFSELEQGTNLGPSIRDMVHVNAGAHRNDGLAIDGSGSGQRTTNMVGLAMDPNGGTVTASFAPLSGVHEQVPNMIFTWDAGTWAGTIFSTRNNPFGLVGSIAVINGVKCGQDIAGVPADGAWLGVQLDTGNFQPTLMGLAVIPEVDYVPAICDVPDFGALTQTAATLDIDYYAAPNSGTFLLLQFLSLAPAQTGLTPPAFDLRALGILGRESNRYLFAVGNSILSAPITGILGSTDASGYLTFSLPNPNSSAAVGLTLMAQGVTINGQTTQLTNAAVIQYK